ncbi:Uncharacterised protein [Mycobacterium tuberculosis]|nr:Uncharacterised protein [Mycobacterium tuberculosis]CKT51521.1 Uncharacterised protein [Mycobacterium tuberculosis]
MDLSRPSSCAWTIAANCARDVRQAGSLLHTGLELRALTIGLAQVAICSASVTVPLRLSPRARMRPTYWDAFSSCRMVLSPPIRSIMACRVLTIPLELATAPLISLRIWARASANWCAPPVSWSSSPPCSSSRVVASSSLPPTSPA